MIESEVRKLVAHQIRLCLDQFWAAGGQWPAGTHHSFEVGPVRLRLTCCVVCFEFSVEAFEPDILVIILVGLRLEHRLREGTGVPVPTNDR